MTLILSITIIAVLLILIYAAYLMLRYKDGDFTIKSSEIIGEGDITRWRNGMEAIIGNYFIIKITYESGRIEIERKVSVN